MSFADVCAAQFPPASESQSATPAPSNLSTQTGTTIALSSATGAKGTTKNTPFTGSNPALAFLVALPLIPLLIPVSALACAPPQVAASPSSVDATNQAGSASDGIQTANLTPAPGTKTAPALAPGNANVAAIATPIPGLPSAAEPSPKVPGTASASAQNPWFLSSMVATNSASSSSSSGSPSVLPNGTGAQSPAIASTPTDAADDQTPAGIITTARENFALNAEMPSQAPVTAAPSEIPSFSPDALPPVTLGNADQASQSQPPVAQGSPAVVETRSAQAAPPESASQVAATPSSQPEQTAPADQKAQPRSAMQPRSPLEQASSSVPGTIPASSAVTATSLASRAALQGIQPASSAASPAPAHASTSSVPAVPAAANIQTANQQTMSTAANNLDVSGKINPAPHQPGNASVSTPGVQDPATSEDSGSKNDAGGYSSDSQQHKASANVAVAAADALLAAPSPAFAVAPPSAQANVAQPSSLPDAGPKSSPQTSAGVPDNAPRSSLPATADAPPTGAASPLQWAQMANKAGQAEMRIGLNTAEFGSVEVRTTVHANDVGVQIGSEKGDLRSLLTPELPGIASTLQQQDLRVTQVSFHQQGFAFTNNSSSFSGGNSQPRSFDWRPQPTVVSNEESSSAEPAHAPEPAVSQRRIGLSILA